MTIISLVSCTGAPGVTTTALATAAGLTATEVHEPVMIELASSGGVVANQYDLPSEPGLTSLALALGTEYPELLAHAQELPGGLPVVFAPPSSSRTGKLLDAKAAQLGPYLQETPATIVADCGRINGSTSLLPVLERSSLIGLLVRPSREGFHLAATTVAELKEIASVELPVGWVLVGACPWSHDEIVGRYGLPVLSVIADDRVGAEAVAGLRRLRRHAPLSRSTQSFADDIAKHLRVSSIAAPLAYLDDPEFEGPEFEGPDVEDPEFEAPDVEDPEFEDPVVEDPGIEPPVFEHRDFDRRRSDDRHRQDRTASR